MFDGWTPEITDDEKAKNLANRLITVIGAEKAKGICSWLIAKYCEVGFDFIRNLENLVTDYESEYYSMTVRIK